MTEARVRVRRWWISPLVSVRAGELLKRKLHPIWMPSHGGGFDIGIPSANDLRGVRAGVKRGQAPAYAQVY